MGFLGVHSHTAGRQPEGALGSASQILGRGIDRGLGGGEVGLKGWGGFFWGVVVWCAGLICRLSLSHWSVLHRMALH